MIAGCRRQAREHIPQWWGVRQCHSAATNPRQPLQTKSPAIVVGELRKLPGGVLLRRDWEGNRHETCLTPVPANLVTGTLSSRFVSNQLWRQSDFRHQVQARPVSTCMCRPEEICATCLGPRGGDAPSATRMQIKCHAKAAPTPWTNRTANVSCYRIVAYIDRCSHLPLSCTIRDGEQNLAFCTKHRQWCPFEQPRPTDAQGKSWFTGLDESHGLG